MLTRKKAKVLLPRGGFSATFTPWNTAQQPKMLDYVAISRQDTCTAPCSDLHFCLEVKREAVLATARHLLALHVSLPSCSAAVHSSSTPRARPRDPMHFAQLNRRRRVRRRWPEWREQHEGQLSSLIPDVVWNDPAALQRALRWAGMASAQKGGLRRATPFDQLERRLSYDRRVTRDRESRKVLPKWILAARAWQRRWRFEQELNDMTAQKKNASKHKRQAGDLLLREPGTSHAQVEAFRSLRQGILSPKEPVQ